MSEERIIDFDPTGQATFACLQEYRLLEAARASRYFVNNNGGLAHLLRKGVGYGVLAEEVAALYLKSKTLIALNGGAAYENQLSLAWYPRPQMPAYFRSLIDAIH